MTAGGAALGNVALSRGMRVEGSPVAAGCFAEALAMGRGTAAARPAERSFGESLGSGAVPQPSHVAMVGRV